MKNAEKIYHWLTRNKGLELAEVYQIYIIGEDPFLGEGEFGAAWETQDKKCFKITKDKQEAMASLKIKKYPSKYINNIYQVLQVKETSSYYIILQKKLEELSKTYKVIIDDLLNHPQTKEWWNYLYTKQGGYSMSLIKDFFYHPQGFQKEHMFPEYFKLYEDYFKTISHDKSIKVVEWYLNCSRDLIKRHIYFDDYSPENIMMDKHQNLRLVDMSGHNTITSQEKVRSISEMNFDLNKYVSL